MAKSKAVIAGVLSRLGPLGIIVWTLVLGSGLQAIRIADGGSSLSTSPCHPNPEALYMVAAGFSHECGPRRTEAAKRLAQHPDAKPWIILLVMGAEQYTDVADREERERRIRAKKFELGVVAVTLRALPNDLDTEVLVALTYLLDERERGQWAEETGLIVVRNSDCISPPIREMARARLRDSLGGDHEWDAEAWRKAILNRTPAPTSCSRPGPSATSRGDANSP